MKSSRLSTPPTTYDAVADIHHRAPDNLLRVENVAGGGVLIRAAKDNFSPARRRAFVRYLKVEGFVPPEARLAAGDDSDGSFPAKGQVRWVFNPSWPYADARFNLYTRRLCARLLLGPTLVWLLFMWIMVLLT